MTPGACKHERRVDAERLPAGSWTCVDCGAVGRARDDVVTPGAKRIDGWMHASHWGGPVEEEHGGPLYEVWGNDWDDEDGKYPHEAVTIVRTVDYDGLLEAARPLAKLADAIDDLVDQGFTPFRDDESVAVPAGELRALRAALSRATGGTT